MSDTVLHKPLYKLTLQLIHQQSSVLLLTAIQFACRDVITKNTDKISCVLKLLTHLFPMNPFSTTWKHQKTLQFSDVFRG